MALGDKPFGINEIKIAALNGSEVAGTEVAIPVGRVLEWDIEEDTEQMTGYNTVVATQPTGTRLTVTLEHGGISLEALAVITGGTVVEAGSTPNETKTFEFTDALTRPYVRVRGRALGNDGGDVEVTLHKVKFSPPGGNFNEGEFYISELEGEGVFTTTDGKLVTWKQKETAAALA